VIALIQGAVVAGLDLEPVDDEDRAVGIRPGLQPLDCECVGIDMLDADVARRRVTVLVDGRMVVVPVAVTSGKPMSAPCTMAADKPATRTPEMTIAAFISPSSV
jgi:hypothetical protein